MAELNPIDLQKALKDIDYPATKDEIVRCAQDNNADQRLVDQLEKLPDEEYQGPNEVSAEVFHGAH